MSLARRDAQGVVQADGKLNGIRQFGTENGQYARAQVRDPQDGWLLATDERSFEDDGFRKDTDIRRRARTRERDGERGTPWVVGIDGQRSPHGPFVHRAEPQTDFGLTRRIDLDWKCVQKDELFPIGVRAGQREGASARVPNGQPACRLVFHDDRAEVHTGSGQKENGRLKGGIEEFADAAVARIHDDQVAVRVQNQTGGLPEIGERGGATVAGGPEISGAGKGEDIPGFGIHGADAVISGI